MKRIRNGLRKFLRLSREEKTLLLRSVALIVPLRIALWVLPSRAVFRLVARWSKRPINGESRGRFTPEQIAWAVNASGGRLLGDGPCLTQALVLLLLFKRRGYPADLRIGVRQDGDGQIRAHAWVESAGSVVIGQVENLSDYKVLPRAESFVA